MITLIDPLLVTFSDGDIVSSFAIGDGINQRLGVFAWHTVGSGDMKMAGNGFEMNGTAGQMAVSSSTGSGDRKEI